MICRFYDHQWTPWTRNAGIEFRHCQKCGVRQQRRHQSGLSVVEEQRAQRPYGPRRDLAAASRDLPELTPEQARQNFLALAEAAGGVTPADQDWIDAHPLNEEAAS